MVHSRIKLIHTKEDTTRKQKTIRSHNKLYLENKLYLGEDSRDLTQNKPLEKIWL